jgi:hypothetical protein
MMLTSGNGFIGLDLPIGPIYFGVGHAEQNRESLFLLLRRTF